MIIFSFLSIKNKFWEHKRNVSRRCFFYEPITYVIIDSKIVCPNLFRIGEYFEISKFEFSRCYCSLSCRGSNTILQTLSFNGLKRPRDDGTYHISISIFRGKKKIGDLLSKI